MRTGGQSTRPRSPRQPPGKRVLDVGCGPDLALARARATRSRPRGAVDASEAMVERAKALGGTRGSRAPKRCRSAGWFDAVVSGWRCTSTGPALEQGARVLSPDGSLVVATEDPDSLKTSGYTLLPVRPRDRARVSARNSSARSSRRPGSAGSRSSTSASIASRPASARSTSSALKGFRLRSPRPRRVRGGLARAEAELPDRFDFTFDWLLAAAT